MQFPTLTDDELRLIDALQVWPRAPWSQLGPILEADPVTLARRWARLTERRLAWVTVQPSWSGSPRSGILEVEYAPGSAETVLGELLQDPECASVDVTSGTRDLVLTVNCPTGAAFSRYVVDRVGNLSGVRTVRAHPVVRPIAVATQWRVRALGTDQVAAIEAALSRDRARYAGTRRAVADPQIERLLNLDGRIGSQAVARAIGSSVRQARERLNATLAAATVDLRTDLPHWASGWPVPVWYFVRVPAAHLSEVGTKLRTLRSIRAIFCVAGPANVLINMWLRDLADIEHLEELMEQQLQGVSVIDRSLVLSVRKRMGRVFDADEMPQDVVSWVTP